MTNVDEIKDLLSDDRHRIRLHEVVANAARECASAISESSFATEADVSDREFIDRLKRYEQTTNQLRAIQALMGFWGNECHSATIALPLKQLCARIKPESGYMTEWHALRWYPVLLLLYAGGISSIARGGYENLRALMHLMVFKREAYESETSVVLKAGKAMSEANGVFKCIPGYENNFTARSQYFYNVLQTELDSLFFLGSDFELFFDEFEVLFSLEYAEQDARDGTERIWGPPGRFSSPLGLRANYDPFRRIMNQAKVERELWRPVKAGLFGGRIDRFMEVATKYEESIRGFR